jgi:hypothetical protein
MARRRQLWHDGATREKIRASMLINRLQDHVRGKVQMSPTQVRAAEILLRKVLPDLLAAHHVADTETVHKFAVVPEVMSKADWLRSRGDPHLLAQLKAEDRRLLELKVATPDDDDKSKLN